MPSGERGPDDLETRTVHGEAVPERHVGPYRLLRELGHGGMGTVYLAVRADQQFTKRVALKIIRGADSAEVVRHFKRERQILASLEHPNIARLLDGGATDDGLPYFVMEHIEGQQILEYCDSRTLSVSDRLKLFQSVCSAVQYAHRNLVVHRDIKPGNILVTAEGSPRLLDFGIAKLLNPELSGEAATATSMLMTPAYASPEQVRGERITTATDVYSLGLVLYELLTGRHPYRLASGHPLDVLRAISEQEPEKPSTAVGRIAAGASTAAERTQSATSAGAPPTEGMTGFPANQPDEPTADSVARTREATPERLKRRLKGDLDNILLLALSKEPQRRYASVEAFSDDVRRHLDGLPVKARRPTAGYRADKFVRRHVVGVAASVIVLVLLLGFAVAMTVQSARVARERDLAQRERETAQRERETAQRVSAFLVDLFKVSDPSEARGNTVTAREVLDKGAAKIATELKDQPEVRATLMDTMGTVYCNLGLYDKAIPLLREALEARRAVVGNEHLDLATSLSNLASVLTRLDDLSGAESLQRESLAIRRKLLGNEHPDVAKSLNGLANVLSGRGNYAEAEGLYREALAMRRMTLGNEHVDVAKSVNNLALVLFRAGDYAGAEPFAREALDLWRKLRGSEHPDVAMSLNILANVLLGKEDYAGAETYHRESLAQWRKLLGNEHPDVAMSLGGLAETLCRKGTPAEAVPLASEALAIFRKTLPPGHSYIADTEGTLGGCLTLMNRYREAEPLLLSSYSVVVAKTEERSPQTRDTLERILRLYEAWGKPDQAARYRAQLAARGPDAKR